MAFYIENPKESTQYTISTKKRSQQSCRSQDQYNSIYNRIIKNKIFRINLTKEQDLLQWELQNIIKLKKT